MIKRSGYQGAEITVARYAQLGLIDRWRSDGRRYWYSERSIEQLKLIPELRTYALDQDEIRQIFEKIPLDDLKKIVGKVPPRKLYGFLKAHNVKLDENWFFKPSWS